MTPTRFVEEEDHMVSALDDSDPGMIRVDRKAAFAYCQEVDHRVQVATGEEMYRQQTAKIKADPIQAGVDACRGGPFGLMVVGLQATAITGMSAGDYFAAILDRVKQQAGSMEDRAAESLVARVREAIEGCPTLDGMIHFGPEDL